MQAEDIIEVNLNIHPKSAVIRTCYAMAERGSFWLTEASEKVIKVNVLRKAPTDNLDELKKSFFSSLVDFTLRETIEEKTKVIRETIILAALTGLKSGKED